MKRLLIISLALCLFCCEQEKTITLAKGKFQISFAQKNGNGSGRSKQVIPAFVLVSIKDLKNNVIAENKKIPLYAFGAGYVSESLELNVGSYKLTQFMVLDAANKVIYATPVEGSLFAQYVNDPLPIDFAITENGSTLVTPQVLEVTEQNTPEAFGYVSFGFEIVSLKQKLKKAELVNAVGDILTYQKYDYNSETGKLNKKSTYAFKSETNTYELVEELDFFYEQDKLVKVKEHRPGVNDRINNYYYENDLLIKHEILISDVIWWYSNFSYDGNMIKQERFTYYDLSYKAIYTIENGNVTDYKRFFYYGGLSDHLIYHYGNSHNPYPDLGFREFSYPFMQNGPWSEANVVSVDIEECNTCLTGKIQNQYNYNTKHYPADVQMKYRSNLWNWKFYYE